MPAIFSKAMIARCVRVLFVFAGAVVLAQTLTTSVPVHADSTSIGRGAELFAGNGCAHCHGDNGIGGAKGPDLKNVARHMNAKQLAIQIHDGGKNMPPYGDALDEKQIADLVVYLRSKRKAAVKVPVPPEIKGSGN